MSYPRSLPYSMLDSLIDFIAGGGDIKVIVVEQPDVACRFPAFSPQTAYNKGCRCGRCRAAHNAAASAWQRADRRRRSAQRAAMRRIQWERRQ